MTLRERWQALDQRVSELDTEFAEQARSDTNARRLTTIPGIGALNATALVADHRRWPARKRSTQIPLAAQRTFCAMITAEP